MDNEVFLRRLRDLSLEEGKAYIREHAEELTDYAATGNLIKDESQRQEHIAPFIAPKLAELLIFFGEHVQHVPSYALGLMAKGNALCRLGQYQAATEFLDASGEEFLRLGDKVSWARSRIAWIIAAAWLGRVEEALKQATAAREVFMQHGEYSRAYTVDHNTAVIYIQLGRYQEALELYESLRAIYPTLTDQSETFIKRAIAMAELGQARNLAWLGNFEQARLLMEKALAGFIALGMAEDIINVEVDLADLDYIQGYYGLALRRYYQVRDSLIHDTRDISLKLAWTMRRLATCLVKLNRAQEACQLAAQAVATYRRLGASLDTGDALREYATTLVASGRAKEALAVLDEAWTMFSRGGFDHSASIIKLQQAELVLESGSIAEAYEQAHLIKKYFEAQGLVDRSVRANLLMARALIESAQQGEVDQEAEQQAILLQEAVLLCKQAALQAREHNLQEEVYKSHYLLGRLFAFQGDFTKAARHYSAAIAQIERILDKLVYDLSPSFLYTTWAVYEDVIALCLRQGQAKRAFSYLEQARSMALRQYLNKSRALTGKGEEQAASTLSSVSQANSAAMLRIQQELKDWQAKYHDYSALLAEVDEKVSPAVDREVIQAELKRCEAKLSELFERLYLYQLDSHARSHTSRFKKGGKPTHATSTQRIDIAQLQQHLSANQLLLAYYLHKSGFVIFAITAEQLVTYENPGGMAQLERLLPLLHAHLQPKGWPNPQQPPQQVIRRLLHKLYDLLVAPIELLLPPSDGSLTIVPYGPLHKLPFHALYNGSRFLVEDFQINYLPASSILMQLDARRNEQHVRSTETAVSARPPLVFGYSGDGYLQRVLDEARTLAAILGGRCYLEKEATIARLIEEAPRSPIIHLATHGHSRLDAPNFSYVRLADGQLNALDAFSLDLQECELVTLSGCETGLALSGGGDEQLGLGRAFLAAGADSLVMSLWPVEDNATNELMQRFYQNLLKGESKVQALRAAQCSLLHQTSSIYTHPYFWAAFRLVGDVGPLQYRDARA